MDRKFYFVSLILLIVVCLGCPQKPPKVIEAPVPLETQIYNKAQALYADKEYQEALINYQEYLVKFPQGQHIDTVLLRMGDISIEKNDYNEAKSMFKKLVAEHSSSSHILDARIGLIFVNFNQGHYNDVVFAAEQVLENQLSSHQLYRLYNILGDTYMAIASPVEAVSYYAIAFKNADVDNQKILLAKVQTGLTLLETNDIRNIINRMYDGPIKAILMRQLGRNYMDVKDYSQAKSIYQKYLALFPQDPHVDEIKVILQDLELKTIQGRYSIGCLLPLSGPYQVFGNRALAGIEMAAAQFFNFNPQTPVKIIIKDTQGGEAQTRLAIQELAEENVMAVIGPMIHVEPAAEFAQENHIPLVMLTQKEQVVETGDHIFNNFLTSRMQVASLIDYAIHGLGMENFAVLYPNEKYGNTFMHLFWDEAVKNGGRIVGAESYQLDQTDFVVPIKKLVGLYYKIPAFLKPEEESPLDVGELEVEMEEEEEIEPEPIIDFDAIFIPDAPEKVGLLAPQLAYYDVRDVFLIGTNLWHSAELIKMAESYIQDAILTDGFFADSQKFLIQEFTNRFLQIYDYQPGFIEAITYDTALLLMDLVIKEENYQKSNIRDELQNTKTYEGLTGRISFDENGNVNRPLFILRIHNKKFIEVLLDSST